MRRWPYVGAAVLALVDLVPMPAASAGSALPAPAHIVVVLEENKPGSAVVGNKAAPYINALANSGANMTQSFAETHPSEPNYLALFSGNTFGLTSDACPVNAGAAPNLASELLAAGYTFGGFSEDIPAVGSPVCSPIRRRSSTPPGHGSRLASSCSSLAHAAASSARWKEAPNVSPAVAKIHPRWRSTIP